MKLITTAVAALAIIGSFGAASAQERTTRTVITHSEGHRGPVVRKKVIIRSSDRGMHRGWDHRHGGMVKKKVIIER